MSSFIDRLGSGNFDRSELKALTTSDREKMKSHFNKRRQQFFYEQSRIMFGWDVLVSKAA